MDAWSKGIRFFTINGLGTLRPLSFLVLSPALGGAVEYPLVSLLRLFCSLLVSEGGESRRRETRGEVMRMDGDRVARFVRSFGF